MNLRNLTDWAQRLDSFNKIEDFVNFCDSYLQFAIQANIQAVIVSKNETNYQFFQYKQDGSYKITRPINSNLWYGTAQIDSVRTEFLEVLDNIRDIQKNSPQARSTLCRSIYTIQQSIGSALDALPSANTARKINGELFEKFVRAIFHRIGVNCTSGVVRVPVRVNGAEQFKMNFQHDLIVRDGEVKAIGSVKTSSKDRFGKVFVDKFLYSKITETSIPHIAIFLNDVQRKGTHPKYGISSTFLPGHFKGYTVKLNPLDGVYYCDIRPNMLTENIIKDHIHTIDRLFFEDLWHFMSTKGAEVEVAEGGALEGKEEDT